jgi:hypothetical protein
MNHLHSTSEQKQRQWAHHQQECAMIADQLNTPLDPGIFATIVAFHALQIYTIGSCEGHLDHGSGAPYVDIEAPNVEEEESHGMRLLDAAEESIGLSLEEIDRQEHAAKEILRGVTHKRLHARAKVDHYLELFYHQRLVSFDCRLVIQSIVLQGLFVGPARLESQGTGLQAIRTLEERQQRLKEYQDEMAAFTLFLQKTFFESEDDSLMFPLLPNVP